MVEAGESEYSGVLKTRKLLIFRNAKNAENCQIASSWNVSGTWDFQPANEFLEEDRYSPATASSFQLTLARCLPTCQNAFLDNFRFADHPPRIVRNVLCIDGKQIRIATQLRLRVIPRTGCRLLQIRPNRQ